MKYLTHTEVRHIASLIKTLNDNMNDLDITLGTTDLYDSNGDVVGRIGITDSGDYGYILEDND